MEQMADSSETIVTSHLCLEYDSRRVLNDISFAVPKGAVVGLVGRNGAGKTSLLRCLVGLATPCTGESHLLGCSSLALIDSVRDRIGYVAQTPDLFEWMDVQEHLRTIGRAYSRWNEYRCFLLAMRLELPLRCAVGKLSFGDKQKLAVVLALAHDPDVLLLDEPVSSLDPLTRREFMRSLFSERVDRTIILSSHLLSDLERVVSHVAFLRSGRLQLFDAWDSLLEHLRFVEVSESEVPRSAVVCGHGVKSGCVVDTRLAPELAGSGQPLALDDLFVVLNQ
jgi:ABC-2 type transport system ATP-binding protein